MTIPGLTFIPHYIGEPEFFPLLKFIDEQPWSSALQRRTQHYGYRYDYTKKTVDRSMYLGPLPPLLDKLASEFVEEGFFLDKPEQAIVNEYKPGQGIAAHTDCVPCFGPVVASVSLISGIEMQFNNWRSGEVQKLHLMPNSLLVLSGEARYKWGHAIIPRHSDGAYARFRRISVTFRTMLLEK